VIFRRHPDYALAVLIVQTLRRLADDALAATGGPSAGAMPAADIHGHFFAAFDSRVSARRIRSA